ncbi:MULTISPECIES: flagellar biosynthesis protein FliQ [Thermotoga]|uniref:Flagellar biosynthetic protein FliQ n=3 Tax=Thermotoga TaxID=2335 RepID=Q9WZG1_THEMA|nr:MULTISPECIES: flagellar biosynthesis protein FliQ [Thermotoga]KUK23880.1 MAG: Flagellar biosynthetic protein FliQ [Thermotoga petrophila]KUK34151.1 MAG: Flagellar biosynthetic protein FliQ [Thermotoga sp. 47_83]MBZ4661409.1 flagellar biosynthesis protein FliQ [Thermotoga sp.]AAD35779.1 flagellar biosynthesis protein FliQ [Thermotoga maritima MSB8]ABQ46262.1 flagellar biosynthetic protein FliQ [Thermotoga petrophila RKU-1]
MTIEVFLDIMKSGISLLLEIIVPPLVVSLIVGLVISIFQAVTQIHEQTLMFAPRIIVLFLTILFLSGWMAQKILDFFSEMLQKYFQMI